MKTETTTVTDKNHHLEVELQVTQTGPETVSQPKVTLRNTETKCSADIAPNSEAYRTLEALLTPDVGADSKQMLSIKRVIRDENTGVKGFAIPFPLGIIGAGSYTPPQYLPEERQLGDLSPLAPLVSHCLPKQR